LGLVRIFDDVTYSRLRLVSVACDCHLLEDLVCLRITYVFGPANIPDFCFSLDFSKISLLDFSCSTKMYDFLVSCYCLPGLALNS